VIVTGQALAATAGCLRSPQMASSTAPAKVAFEAHEAGEYNLRQAMRRMSVAVTAFALALVAVGFAGAKGGLIGLAIEGVVVVGFLAFPLVQRASWANPDTWLLGLFGEAMVAHLLAMLAATFHCVHDIPLRSNGKRSNIDHLVVGPTGIWVIETKNWKGEFQKRDGILLHNGYDQSTLIQRTVASTFDVRAALGTAQDGVRWINVVIVSTKARVPEPLDFGKAVVVGASDVIPLIRGGKQVLSLQQVERIGRCLGMLGDQPGSRRQSGLS
jgi:multisubunit Na+/H+ antiporter MnhB subunit